jgi:hypothetical protein
MNVYEYVITRLGAYIIMNRILLIQLIGSCMGIGAIPVAAECGA